MKFSRKREPFLIGPVDFDAWLAWLQHNALTTAREPRRRKEPSEKEIATRNKARLMTFGAGR